MKKFLIVSALVAAGIAGCKKEEANVSETHNYSTPTLHITSGTYYSIPVGGTVQLSGTAFDSFYNEDATVVYDQSLLDNTTPGIYPVIASAKNQYGMASRDTLWVAVTNMSSAVNLAGKYLRIETDDTVTLTRLANGFYETNDAAANGVSDVTHVIPAWFVQASDVELVMPEQASKFGTIYGSDAAINMSIGDTTYEYKLNNDAFLPIVRVFRKIQ